MKKIRVFGLVLLLLLSLSACGGGGTKPSVEQPTTPPVVEPDKPNVDDEPTIPLPDENTLVIAIEDEIEGLDVQQISYGNMVHDLVAEPLVVYSTDLTELHPAFAESFTLTDDYIEFVLPADARFSNGDKLDAEAVKASTERFLAISEYVDDLDTLTSIDVIDERTVRYNFSAPSPYSIADIASLFCGIVDVAEVGHVGDWEFNRCPVMNGAYYVDEWVEGSHLVLKRNEYFHTNNPALKNHGLPNFETIVIRFIPDGEERMRELDAGRVDIAYHAPTYRWAELEANSNYNVWSYQQPGVCYLNLQTNQEPLRDIRVRQALTYAVDRDAINEVLGGIVTPFYGFLVPAQAGYSAEEEEKLSETLRYDPEHARALLAEAGWKDIDGDGIVEKNGEPLSFYMMIPSDRYSFMTAGGVLEKQFAAIGVDTEVLYEPAEYIKERMRADDYTIGSRAYEWNDADILYWCFTEESGYRWEDQELTALLNTARHINDPDERAEAYVAVSERLMQDFKAIALYADNFIIVSKSNLTGIATAMDDRVWFNDVVKN